MVVDLEPNRPNLTKPTSPTYLTYHPEPPNLLIHLTYPPTWPTQPPVLPTHLIYLPMSPTQPDNCLDLTDNLQEEEDSLPELTWTNQSQPNRTNLT